MRWRGIELGAAMVAGVALALVTALPANADSAPPGTIGSFPTWSLTPSAVPGETAQGAATFSAIAGFPATTWITNSATTKVPSGDSAFLGSSTGFGQTFGSSRAQPYLYLSPAASGPSTTTITFAGPPPAGWGFAVGDIDADFVEIIPRDASNAVLGGGVLGAQDTGGTPLLNYCNNSPKPSSCGTGPFTDSPLWYPNGTTIGATTYTTPLVVGNVADTSGAYDWFLPSTAVRSLTFVFHVQSGFPIFQIWLAALAPASTITGVVQPSAGSSVPAGTDVDLEQSSGSPVVDVQGDPVEVPVAADGSYSLTAEEGEYELAFTVPPGDDPIPPEAVDATGPAATAPTVLLVAKPALATTGIDPTWPLGAALLLIGVGSVVVCTTRRFCPRVGA
jgi:hypothetical protein